MEHANVLIDPSTWHFEQLGPCAYGTGLLRTQRVDDSRKATKSAALDCAFRILRATHYMPHTVLSAGKAYVTGNGFDIVTQHASDGIRLTAPGIFMNRRRVPGGWPRSEVVGPLIMHYYQG